MPEGKQYAPGSGPDGLPGPAVPADTAPAESAPGGAGTPPAWVVVTAATLALYLAHPSAWGFRDHGLWFPPAGLGLAAVAWLGARRGAVALLGGGLLVLLQGAPRLALGAESWSAGELALAAAETALLAVELPLGWWLYHRCAEGNRQIADPRSATQFIFIVPGIVAGLFALARAGLGGLMGPAEGAGPFGPRLAHLWLGRALGEMALAPPLLVVLTGWLAGRGLVVPEARRAGRPGREEGITAAAPGGAPPRWGDWLEIAGLAAGAAVLCLLLTWLHGRGRLSGWQLWGAPLLLIVWASLRQGSRGGVLVAAAAAAVPLLALPVGAYGASDPLFGFLLQGHFLAQCSAALLTGAAAGWLQLRESAYRQVASQVPVVIYRARLRAPARPGEEVPVAPGLAEVTLVSAASRELFGCPPEQLLGDYGQWRDRIHPDDHEVLLAALAQLTRQEQPVTCEYRLADGGRAAFDDPAAGPAPPRAPRWLRDTLVPHRDAERWLAGWEGVVSDISEQRALADDLRQTTSMFNALVSNLPAGVFFVQGPHGKPILVNARARHLLGQREDSSAGLEHLPQVYRLFRADGSPYPLQELPVYQALRHGRTTMRDDIVVHRPDGRRIPLVTWAAPVLLGPGAAQETAVWVLEDRTALHQAEAARQDSERRLRAVVETMAEGLVVQDRAGRIVDANPAARTFLGDPAERLVGRQPGELGWTFLRESGAPLEPGEHPSEVALRTGWPVRNVLLGLARASAPAGAGPATPGAARWVLVNAMPLGGGLAPARAGPEAGGRVPADTPAGVVTTYADLTAYVQAREQTRASEERYRELIESLPMMLILADRERRVLYANPTTRTITGYELEEFAEPALWSRLIHPEDLPRVGALAESALAGVPVRGEFRFRAKSGAEKTCFAMIQPCFRDGAVVGTTTLLVDVSRERQLERELERSQRLELVGRLSSGVAHDFNNLLTVVLGLADLARCHLPPEHPVHDDLQHITEAGQQAANLASRLLALGKQRRGMPRPVEVNGVARRTLELLRPVLSAGVDVETDLTGRDLWISADDLQVQQVLMNLFLNARDAMANGGVLRVRTRPETGYGGEPCAEVTVSDTGPGINEQVLSRIFEPFFSTKEGGTGLGLAVVQQIVESFGGSIAARSAPGQGARFTVRWPLAEVPERGKDRARRTADLGVGS
jgi:PAS domain S-box-containing protein